jgi:hypothetical protein
MTKDPHMVSGNGTMQILSINNITLKPKSRKQVRFNLSKIYKYIQINYKEYQDFVKDLKSFIATNKMP